MLSRPREQITASACASVLSFVLVRELALYDRPLPAHLSLPSRWSYVREITRQRQRDVDGPALVSIVETLGGLIDERRSVPGILPIQFMCRELTERGELQSAASAIGPSFEKLVRGMGGTREERVDVFERALHGGLVVNDAQIEAFALGYLASRINPGTLGHAALLAPVLQRSPAAMLWYGVCAGFAEGNGLLSELGGVGRRVLRDVHFEDAVVGRPRADIGGDELVMLLDGDRPERAEEFPVSSPSQLSVELIPGVTTVLNWSSRGRARRGSEGTERTEDRAWIEYELAASISRLVDLRRRIRSGDAYEPEAEHRSEQANFFDPSAPPGRRRSPKKR